MSRTTDMTQGSPVRLILGLTFPLILTNAGQQFYMITDASIVGRGIGVDALAAVGASDWIYWMFLWAITGMTQGFGIFVSRYFGEKEYTRMNKALAISVLLCGVLGGGMTLLGLVIAHPLLQRLHTPADIIGQSNVYLTTMVVGLPVVVAYNMAGAVLRAFGNGRHPLYAMVIAGGLNIGLDLLCVLCLRWGVFGAALASVVSQLVAFLYCIWQLRKIDAISLDRDSWRVDWPLLRSMLAFGLPLSLQYIVIAVSGIALQSTINAQGSGYVAGFTATNKLYGLLESSALSLGLAFATYYSQNYGAGKYERLREGVRSGLAIAIAMSFIVTAGILLFGKPMLRLFIAYDAENSAGALTIAWRYLFTMSLFLVVIYPIHIYRNALQGLGNATWPMLSGFAESATRALLGTVAVHCLGVWMLFLVEPASWLAALVVTVAPYYPLQRKHLKPLAKN